MVMTSRMTISLLSSWLACRGRRVKGEDVVLPDPPEAGLVLTSTIDSYEWAESAAALMLSLSALINVAVMVLLAGFLVWLLRLWTLYRLMMTITT